MFSIKIIFVKICGGGSFTVWWFDVNVTFSAYSTSYHKIRKLLNISCFINFEYFKCFHIF